VRFETLSLLEKPAHPLEIALPTAFLELTNQTLEIFLTLRFPAAPKSRLQRR